MLQISRQYGCVVCLYTQSICPVDTHMNNLSQVVNLESILL